MKNRIIIVVILFISYIIYIYNNISNYLHAAKLFIHTIPFSQWLTGRMDIAVTTMFCLIVILYIIRPNDKILFTTIAVSAVIFIIWDFSNHKLIEQTSSKDKWLGSFTGAMDIISLIVLFVILIYLTRKRDIFNNDNNFGDNKAYQDYYDLKNTYIPDEQNDEYSHKSSINSYSASCNKNDLLSEQNSYSDEHSMRKAKKSNKNIKSKEDSLNKDMSIIHIKNTYDDDYKSKK